jgi:hypothetical protein
VRTNRGVNPAALAWPWLVSGIAVAVVAGGVWFGLKCRAKVAGYASMSPGAMMALAMCAILQELINVMETYVVLAWLGAAPTFETAVALEGLNRLANAPAQLIPGKLGVLELAGSAFAGILQLGSANGLTLVLARRVRSLIWTGVGILLLTTSASRVRTARSEPVIIG